MAEPCNCSRARQISRLPCLLFRFAVVESWLRAAIRAAQRQSLAPPLRRRARLQLPVSTTRRDQTSECSALLHSTQHPGKTDDVLAIDSIIKPAHEMKMCESFKSRTPRVSADGHLFAMVSRRRRTPRCSRMGLYLKPLPLRFQTWESGSRLT